jgi:hypothetical protein
MTHDPDYRELESYVADYLLVARRKKHLNRAQKYQSALSHAMYDLAMAHFQGRNIDVPLFAVNCIRGRMRYYDLD